MSQASSTGDFGVSRDSLEYREQKTPQYGASEGTFGSTTGLDEFYKPIESYEGAHRYDPSYTWEPSEEKRIVRKVSVPF
jgi:hypothetical protein